MSRPNTSTTKALKMFAFALAPAALLSACDQSATGPVMEEEPTLYRLTVETRMIEVLGTCDRDDIFGNANAGEFQYRVDVIGEGQNNAHQSRGYNSVTGDNFKRHKGQDIDFTNRTYTWVGLPTDARVDAVWNPL